MFNSSFPSIPALLFSSLLHAVSWGIPLSENADILWLLCFVSVSKEFYIYSISQR